MITKRVLLGLAVMAAPVLAACSSDGGSSFNLLPRAGFDSLSLKSAAPKTELRPVTAADFVDPQGHCAGADASAARGGIALEMTECEVVNRAGPPGNVEIGTNERGERSVTLTYTSGPRPGIYRFAAGRLYSIERGEEPPPEPAKAKKPPAKKASSA
ncbi:MAG TPA: hypothetical protein VKW08_11730 [Xanthobacteraceae bacterium]|nr:hypothetical protein [Xanthobacteraceae bacterium]